MRTLIVYYSLTGTTRKVAEQLSKRLRADMEEIVDKKKRSGILGSISANLDAFLKRSTGIGESKCFPGEYDLVLIGTPVWAFTITPAVRSYLEKYKNNLKKVAFFCTKGGSPGKPALFEMAKISGHKPAALLELNEKECKTAECLWKIEKFVKEIGLKA